MKTFALDENGDLLIEKNNIVLTCDKNLLIQKIKTVIQTTKRESFFNLNEGISRKLLTGKPKAGQDFEEIARNEIIDALSQVDESLQLTAFSYDFNSKTRTAVITFSAQSDTETLELTAELP